MRNWIRVIVDKGTLLFLSLVIFFCLLGAGQFLYKVGFPFSFVSLLEALAVYGGVFLVQRFSLLATNPRR